MENMKKYGLNDKYKALSADYPELMAARVTAQEKGLYRVVCGDEVLRAELSGRFRYEAALPSDYPAVGDFVLLSPGVGQALIQRLLPRKSVFIRKAAGTANTEQVVAANIDTVFLCMSLNNDFNLRRLERYLSIAWESGASPVVVLTKADICEDAAEKRAEAERIAIGADVIVTSAMAGDGYESIKKYLTEGQTVALIGSSGVGKSTLINRLLGEERLSTNGLRNDDKGRHTTTHRELLLLPDGGMVIDTPGMRELGMWDAAEGVDKTFADIAALAEKCRFADCTHENEPGCAVRAALESGELPAGRMESWRKLRIENAYSENSGNYLAAKEKKFKEIAKRNKSNTKR